MTEFSYNFRPSILRGEETYRAAEDALVRTAKGIETRIPFGEIQSIRTYRSPGIRMFASTAVPGFERCVIRPRHGRNIALSSNHFLGLGRFEDRSATYAPFVEGLIHQVAMSNPATIFRTGMPMILWSLWALILVSSVIIAPLAALLIIIEMVQNDHIDTGLLFSTFILLAIFFQLFSYIRMLRRNWPRRYDPRTASSA
jgi:hypothetical protein